MTIQPTHLFSAWRLMIAGSLLAFSLFMSLSTDYAQRGIERIVRLVATNRIEDWSTHIAEKYPSIIRNFGKAPIPDEALADLRREAELYGVKAFEIIPPYDSLGKLRVYARNTFADPEHKLATAALKVNSPDALKERAGLVKVRVPLKDMKGHEIGELVAVADEKKLHARLIGALRHVLLTALAVLAIILVIALFLFRRLHTDAELHLHRVRDYDDLTGLPNHHAFEEILDELTGANAEKNATAMAQAGERTPFACISLGINELGKITCSEGHEGAGHVLRTMAGRFARVAHEHGAHVFRMERDEFIIILPTPGQRQQAYDLAEKLQQEAYRPLYWRGKSLAVTLAVGITFFPEDAATRAEVVRQATLVRRAAREAHGGICVYDVNLDKQYNEKAAIERLLRKAARNCSSYFSLNFQPIVELEHEHLHGFEALLRLTDDEGNTISPEVFVPMAEQLGLMDDIGAWVLKEACIIAAHWPDHLHVAVNLSPTQFESGELVSHVAEALETSGLAPHRLELEVTESLMMGNWDAASTQLEQFRARGMKIVLDDFGTGYSSMNYLWKFRFDKLKIDRSFTQATFASSEARNILRALLVMARSLRLPVVAEGIETLEQAVFLRKFRCNYGQGWYYGKPKKAAELSAIIMRDWQRRRDVYPRHPDAAEIARRSAAL